MVRRSVAAELPDGGTTLFAAHGLDRYAETAALLDATEEERIGDFRATLSGFLGDREQGTASLWRAERVPSLPPADVPAPSAAAPGAADVPAPRAAAPGAAVPGTVPEVSPGGDGRTGAGPGR